MKFKREFSAGCIVFKKLKVISHKPSVVFLLGKHSGYHQWVLPKGLIEEDEHGWQTALRETEEEMAVKVKLVDKKPIHELQYFFVANYKNTPSKPSSPSKPSRRVSQYQEKGGAKTKVFKTVSFYLAQYLSGDPKNHGWEMEEAGWFSYQEVLQKLAFKGEKEALQKAKKVIEAEKSQPRLF